MFLVLILLCVQLKFDDFFSLSQRVFSQWPAVYYSYEVHGRPDTDAKPQGKWYVCLCLSLYLFMRNGAECVSTWIKERITDIRLEHQGLCNQLLFYLPAPTALPPEIPWYPESQAVIVIWLLSSFATVWPPPSSFLLLTSHLSSHI